MGGETPVKPAGEPQNLPPFQSSIVPWSRALQLLTKCRSHGGHLSQDNMQLLESLTYDELLFEGSYLIATIAKDLRLKHKVYTGVGINSRTSQEMIGKLE